MVVEAVARDGDGQELIECLPRREPFEQPQEVVLRRWWRERPKALVERALGSIDAVARALRFGGHALGELVVADVVAADFPGRAFHGFDGGHQVGAHLRRVDVVVAQGRVLDDGQETGLAGEPLGDVVDGMHAADRVQRTAVVLRRQLRGADHRQRACGQ